MQIYDDCNEGAEIVDNLCLPFLGALQLSFENKLHNIEIFIEGAIKRLESIIIKIKNFLTDLWTLWKAHELELKKTEEIIYQKLNAAYQQHQKQNVMVENEFNAMIDKMRQDPNEHSLKESLKKCLNLLDKIKTSYTNFCNQQVQTIKKYPSLTEKDVEKFENDIKNYFKEFHGNLCNTKNNNAEIDEKPYDSGESDKIVLNILEISDDQYFNLLEKVEDNFKNFIKMWYETVRANSNKIVSVKIDELESELKLRNHLHEPRYKRIEYDVHNVRAAELSIHSERVSKQAKGIETSLNIIMEDLIALERENKMKQDQFKDRLSADEKAYLNITNNSKLFNMQKLLESRNIEYMNSIRISLRNFRKDVEKKLQNLRQTNAEFVRSFKFFSAGGNFCVEEVEEFTKKIEITNRKIDDVESEILSNLETIEKQQQDSLIQFQGVFEEKFKYHIIDINFLEKINRGFYNLQVKIKTEVSNSNSHSQIICENLQKLKTILSELKWKQTCSQLSVFNNILASFDNFHDRCIYLDCIKTQSNPKIKSTVEDINGLATNKVQFSAITILSKIGKQPNEDVGIRTVRNLLQSQNPLITQDEKCFKGFKIGLLTDFKSNDKDSIEKTIKTKDKFHQRDNKGNIKGSISRSTSIISESNTSGSKANMEKSKLVSKNQRLDKKYLVFGEESSINSTNFLNKIKLFIKETLDGILFAAEIYYRNKGVRKVTHPNIQDSFDQAADEIIIKLKFYFKQAEDYYSECLQEFNKQLIELENVINLFPLIMYSNLLDSVVSQCNQSLEESVELEVENFKKLLEKKLLNHTELRSDFGNPNKMDDFKNLCLLEESRQNEEYELILKSFENNNNIIYSCGKQFVKMILESTEQLLLLVDNILTTDDINVPIAKEELVNTTHLIKSQLQIISENLSECKVNLKSSKTTWLSNDLTDILSADSNKKESLDDNLSECLISSKQTSCHVTLMNERLEVTKKFKSFYFGKLDHNKTIKDQRLYELANYKIFWSDSTANLQKLDMI